MTFVWVIDLTLIWLRSLRLQKGNADQQETEIRLPEPLPIVNHSFVQFISVVFFFHTPSIFSVVIIYLSFSIFLSLLSSERFILQRLVSGSRG